MITQQQIESLVERFFELLDLDNPTAIEQAELHLVIQKLGLTREDLRDLAAQCRRRAIYLNNVRQPA